MRCFSSCGFEKRTRSVEETLGQIPQVAPFTDSLRYVAIRGSARRVTSYQKVHGLSKLLSHLQLPQDVDRALVLFQVGVQGAELHKLLNHYV